MLRWSSLFAACLALLVSIAPSAMAEGMIHTGDGVRTKSLGLFSVKVYAIRHDMKERPATKSKQAVIDADVDKKFTWMMLRDVDCSKIRKALKDAFEMNGFTDARRIEQFIGTCKQEEVKEKSSVVIAYNAAAKAVTVSIQGGGSATIEGVDFMKAVWSIWFGKIDQPALGDSLISKL